MLNSLSKLLVSAFSTVSLSFLSALIDVNTASAADRVRFFVGPKEFSVSIDSLDRFATSGELEGELEFISQFVDEASLNTFRAFLAQKQTISVVMTNRLLNSAVGNDLLEELGAVIRTNANLNGFQSIRAAVVLSAADRPDGWTPVDVLRRFPSESLRIDLNLLGAVQQQLSLQNEYRLAAIAAIRNNSTENQSANDVGELSELQSPGPYAVETLTIQISHTDTIRQTPEGLSAGYDFDANIYLPEETAWPAPVVAISHGFGSVKENFVLLGEHLASYGYIVVVPEHIGSNLGYRESFLLGNNKSALSPLEFADRPEDISIVLDRLEQLNNEDEIWSERLDLDSIGVAGFSLGGTTALSLAGATINRPRIQEFCQGPRLNLDPSEVLQCQARHLPPGLGQLGDPRIDAAIAAHPLSSVIFGPEGLSTIDIPIALVAGSEDLVSPVVTNQIHPFVWLNAPERYLAVLDPGSHWVTTLQPGSEGGESIPQFLLGNTSDAGREFMNGFAVAFFNRYLQNDEAAASYLTPRASSIEVSVPLNTYLINRLTADELVDSFGQSPPIEVIPAPLQEQAIVSPNTGSILEEIARTGVLKVGIRRDASPFGYIDSNHNWSGFCRDLSLVFARDLDRQIDSDGELDVVFLESTLDNRFQLVNERSVHFECGPNTIQDNLDGVTFSQPFFVTGAQFLLRESAVDAVNPVLDLDGVNIGVLDLTTTASFITERYPKANRQVFEGPDGRRLAVQSLQSGQIDAFATDGVLGLGEVLSQELPLNDFRLVPERPLTCEYYGLIVPSGDNQWLQTINRWLESDAARQSSQIWLGDRLPTMLLDFDACLNRT
ncbi:MAG: alpha/beta hydrolase [Synechococcus sp.]